MSRQAAPPSVSIDRISVTGVDAQTATAIGPAVEAALGEAMRGGKLSPGHRRSITVHLPHGTSPQQLARAVAKALGQVR